MTKIRSYRFLSLLLAIQFVVGLFDRGTAAETCENETCSSADCAQEHCEDDGECELCFDECNHEHSEDECCHCEECEGLTERLTR